MDGFNLIFAGRLRVTAVLRCLFLQHTKTSSCLVFYFTGARTPRWLASSEASLFSSVCVKNSGGRHERAVQEVSGHRSEKEEWYICTSREVSSCRGREEGAQHRWNFRNKVQLRRAGFALMAVQTDSFQVRLESRSQRVRGIIHRSKDVEEL